MRILSASLMVVLLLSACESATGPGGGEEGGGDGPPDAHLDISSCEGLQILTGFDASLMPADYDGAIVDPGPTQVAVIEEAFSLAPEILCKSAEYVAYAEKEGQEKGLLGWVYNARPHVIFISALPDLATEQLMDPETNPYGPEHARQLQINTIHSALHEAAHAAHLLLDGHSTDGGPTPWRASTNMLGQEKVTEFRLAGGFEEVEWVRMHEAFVDIPASGTAPYGSLISEFELAESGFMSGYGSVKPSEDIAEMVAWSLVGSYLDHENESYEHREDHACTELNTLAETGVPLEYAAAYTKLSFLHDLGFITDGAFEWCVGSVGKKYNEAPSQVDGLHILDRETGEVLTSFTEGVEGTMGERPNTFGELYFQLVAEGTLKVGTDEEGYTNEDARALLFLDLDPPSSEIAELSWPRGLYRLQTPTNGSNFIIDIPGRPANSVWATDGFVLVVHASNDRIEGGLVVQGTVRPLAPVPVPEASLQTDYHFLLTN